MYGKSRIIFVILILLGTAIMPATIGSSIEQNAPIKITTYEGIVIEKQLPMENINELLSLLNILKENPSEYRVYLPVILKKLEEFGLIEDAIRTEKAILENIKEYQLNGPGNIFMNAFCFIELPIVAGIIAVPNNIRMTNIILDFPYMLMTPPVSH